MKKSLIILASVLTLGFTGTSFAATPVNPFDDVPSNHWAYSAVNQLAKDGLIDGYGDKTFRGDSPITRYEMAVLVGKAMSKSAKTSSVSPETKAALSKLEDEFSSELDKLGVRLKAVEAKVDNVKWDGELQAKYQTRSVGKSYEKHNGWHYGGQDIENEMIKLRNHIQVGDEWTIHSEFQGGHDLRDGTASAGDDDTNFTLRKMYVEGPMFGTNMYLGKFDPKEVDGARVQAFDPMFWDIDVFNGAKFEFGNKIKTSLFYGRVGNSSTDVTGLSGKTSKYAAVRFDTTFDNVKVGLMLHDVEATSKADKTLLKNSYGAQYGWPGWGKDKVTATELSVGTPVKFIPIPGKWYTWSTLTKTNATDKNTGIHIGLSYNDPPDRKIPGQWGAWTMYHNQQTNAALNPFGEAKGWELEWSQGRAGFIGWELGVNYVPFVDQRIMVREIIGRPHDNFYFSDGAKMGNEKAFRIEWDFDF